MRHVLLVIPSLDYSGAARQLTLLAAGLPRNGFRVRVAVLGRDAPWAENLRAAGVEVDVLGWTRLFDPAPFLALRRIVADFRPDLLHAWGATALRTLRLCGADRDKTLVSAALPPGSPPGALDRWLLGRAGGVLALGAAEGERYRRAGVDPARVVVVPPGVGPVAPAAGSGRGLLVIGPVEPHKGFREAVWAFDILRQIDPGLRLVIAGDGTGRARVEAFTHSIGITASVQFTGRRRDLGPLLDRAAVVWVPSLRGGGRCAALDAMAAGRPVVAARVPELAEVVVDGETGYLVEPGDKAGLARQTRRLLEDPECGRRFGAAGRRRAQEDFPAAALVEAVARAYEAGGTKVQVPT